MELDLQFPEITSWIRASKEDFQLVQDLGIKETGILVSCSDYHIFKKMKMTRAQAMDYYLATVKDAFEAGVMPRCHLEDITRADFYGFVVPFVNELVKLSEEAGIPVKIRACDTMGYGVPYTEVGAAPQRARHHLRPAALLRRAQRNAGVARPQRLLQGRQPTPPRPGSTAPAPSTARCWASASAPATSRWRPWSLNTRPCAALSTAWTPRSSPRSPTTSRTRSATRFRRMTPFVGRNFNVTQAGIHADGLLKDEEIYNIFNTKKLLNRPATVQVGKTSGLAGIAYWINENYQPAPASRSWITSSDPLVEQP